MANFYQQTTNRDFAQILERKIIKHCAPTLCGIKPGCLFLIPFECLGAAAGQADSHGANLGLALQSCRKKLAAKGVRIVLLAKRSVGYVVYVYRPSQLRHSFSCPATATFLAQEGYDYADVESCVSRLRRRMKQASVAEICQRRCAFPHEIGIFLGYPLEDVVGFIENQGENYLFCGCWKVYSNERDARACFCRYKECTRLLRRRFDEGEDIERLTVGEKGKAC